MRSMHGVRAPDRSLPAAGITLLALAVSFLVAYRWPNRPARPSPHTGEVGRPSSTRVLRGGPALAGPAVDTEAGAAHDAVPAGPVYHPRDEHEWQGMLVDLSMRAVCEGAGSCGLAAACIDGQCGPCDADAQCGEGEVCVLDHCVLSRNVRCRSRHDCSGDDARCVLSGYSSDPRGNGDMRAECVTPRGGLAQTDAPPIEGIPAPPPPVNADELLDSVRALAGNPPERPAGGGAP